MIGSKRPPLRWLWVAIALTAGGLSFSGSVLASSGPTVAEGWAREQSCTSFAVSSSNGVYLADSEDGNIGHPGIDDPASMAAFFWPSSETTFGRMHIGFLIEGEHHSYQAGMNDQGLAYSATAVPHVAMNPHPERPFSWNHDHVWDTMLGRAATAVEAVGIAESFDYTEGLWFQTMVADADGNVAVIGPGNDGELAITWEPANEEFMVASTINVATGESEGGSSQARYDTAATMLSDAASRRQLDSETVADVLQAVTRQDWYTLFALNTYTVYSDYFDLQNRTVSISYLSNFDEVASIDLGDELSKGAHHVMLVDLFSDVTVQEAIEKFDSAGLKGYFAMFGIIAVVVSVLIMVVAFLARWVVRRRRRRSGEAPAPRTEAPAPITF
jgi:hypothetical protein